MTAELRRCPACGGGAFEPLFSSREMFGGEAFAVERCTGCGLSRTADDLTEEQLAGYYHYAGGADAGARFVGYLEPMMRALRRARLREVRRAHPEPGRALDVGCGRGVMLAALAELGWDVYGTEVDAGVAKSAIANLGARIQVGQIEDLEFTPATARPPLSTGSGQAATGSRQASIGSEQASTSLTTGFDIVTFWHVLEHLAEPLVALRRAAELLAPGGAVIVALPNLDSWQARLAGRHWLHLDVPRHRWHFSPATLSRLADRAGLRLARVQHFSLEYGPYGLLQSLLARAGLGPFLFTDILRPTGGSRRALLREPRLWAHAALAAPIAVSGAASLPIELLAAAAGAGGSITATLKKRD